MIRRATIVSTLTASWAELARATGGTVQRGPGYFAVRSPQEVFNNALLLDADVATIDVLGRFYDLSDRWALWSPDDRGNDLAQAAGLARDGGTTDMARRVDDLSTDPDVQKDIEHVDPSVVAVLNGLAPHVVAGAQGFRGLATGGQSGALLFRHGNDVQLSFLATTLEHRRMGLATRVVMAALDEARRSGATTVSLQSTPSAVPLYRNLGFATLGRWTEWVPPSTVGDP